MGAIAAVYLTILWLVLVVVGARMRHRFVMMLALLFLSTASVNSYLDHMPELQAIGRMILNTIVFTFVIYAARRFPDVKQ